MKRLLCGLLFAIWFAIPAFAESDIPSIAIKEEPIFDGLGFSIKGNAGEEYAVTEFHLSKLVQVDLRNQSVTGEKAYKAVVAFKGEKFPVKVISPDFKKFEADIMDPKTIGNPQGVAIPIGHITF
ncbi:hypothetical protein HYY75_13070, partial [bacterium]|nr:hypothetical protein [bacterium]